MVPFKRLSILVLLVICLPATAIAPALAGKLTDAVKARDVVLVRNLLAAGEDVKEKVRGDYPLNVACLFGPFETVEALLDAGADIEQPGRDGLHPLHNAVASGHLDIVVLLTKSGAKVDAKDTKGRTPLLYFAAIGGSNNEIARILLAAGADPGSMDVDLNSSLHHAALTNHLDLVELLIAAHADLNHQSLRGETALHIAAHHLQFDIAKVLIAAGADLNLKMVSGLTPLGDTDDQAMRQLLIEAGAK